jgi:hypothetical protein
MRPPPDRYGDLFWFLLWLGSGFSYVLTTEELMAWWAVIRDFHGSDELARRAVRIDLWVTIDDSPGAEAEEVWTK